jgi:hypothetical protein
MNFFTSCTWLCLVICFQLAMLARGQNAVTDSAASGVTPAVAMTKEQADEIVTELKQIRQLLEKLQAQSMRVRGAAARGGASHKSADERW